MKATEIGVDLSHLEESNPSEAVTPAQQAATSSVGGAASSAPAEPQVSSLVIKGAGPSAPSRPPRTRGARGGKDSQYQKLRRAYFQGYDKARSWLFEHTRPRYNRPGFNAASARHQELLINWDFYSGRASVQQILCVFEFLIPHFAQWVTHNG